jgi:hypothetical protein
MPAAGLKTIIALSFVLAVGFLLVILSCALYKAYYPLLVVGTYVVAPLPNWICGRLANPDDFVESSGSAVLDLGRFCTGFLVVMGIGTCSTTSVSFDVPELDGSMVVLLASMENSAKEVG